MQNTTGSNLGGAAEKGAERIGEMSGKAQDAASRAADAAAASARRARAKGEEYGEQWMDTQDAWVQNARECIRDHPIASVAVAAGVAYVLSRLRR